MRNVSIPDFDCQAVTERSYNFKGSCTLEKGKWCVDIELAEKASGMMVYQVMQYAGYTSQATKCKSVVKVIEKRLSKSSAVSFASEQCVF